MGVERLQLLMRCCNVSGLLPFRMVLNNRTKQFKRFDTHWRHPANWWFVILLVGHVFLSIVFIYLAWFNLTRDDGESLSIVHLVGLILLFVNVTIMFSLPRLFLLHVQHLETAFGILHRFDGNSAHISTNSRDNVLRHTYVGIVITFIWLSIIFLVFIPILNDALNYLGLILGSLYLCLQIFNQLQDFAWFTLFHLCYYNISYRINILSSLIEIAIKEEGKSEKCKRIKAMRVCTYLFDQLCAATIEINSTYSLSILGGLTIAMITCSLCLFFFTYAMTEVVVHTYIRNATYTFPITFILFMGFTLFILFTVDKPIKQMKRLRDKVMQLSARDDLGNEELIKSIALIDVLNPNRIQLTAGGIISVGLHLIPMWIHTVITYLVIFLQGTNANGAAKHIPKN